MTNKERFEKAVKAAKEKRYAKYFEGMPTHEQITVSDELKKAILKQTGRKNYLKYFKDYIA